eukprot:767092-Hanusia_phi.AAC.2
MLTLAQAFLRCQSRSYRGMNRVSTRLHGRRTRTATSALVADLLRLLLYDVTAAGDDAHALIWDLQALPRAIEGWKPCMSEVAESQSTQIRFWHTRHWERSISFRY